MRFSWTCFAYSLAGVRQTLLEVTMARSSSTDFDAPFRSSAFTDPIGGGARFKKTPTGRTGLVGVLVVARRRAKRFVPI